MASSRFFPVLFSLFTIASAATHADDSLMSNGEDLGKWWLKSAKAYSPLPEPLLYHFEGMYSYSETSGNVEAEAHGGNVELNLRKHLFTSVTDYHISNRTTTKQVAGKEIILKDQRFVQALRLALTEKVDAVVGGAWTRNTAKYVQDRVVYYGGARFTALDTPNLNLLLGAFYGDTDTSFMNSEIRGMFKYRDFPSVEDYQSEALYLTGRLHWQITPTIGFDSAGDYMKLWKDSAYYFWRLKTDLNFKISKHFSFVTSYSISYDFNPFIDSLQQYLDQKRLTDPTTGDVYTRDTALSFGIKLTF